MKNERTSQRVAKIAAKYLPMTLRQFREEFTMSPLGVFRDVKSLAGTAQTQAPDRKASVKARNLEDVIEKILFNLKEGVSARGAARQVVAALDQRHLVRVKAEGFDQVLVGPVELMEPRK